MNGRRVRRVLRPDVNPAYLPPPIPKPPTVKRRRRLVRTAFWLVVIAGLATTGWLVFRVQDIEVTNSQHADEIATKVEAAIARPWWYRHLFWLPSGQIADQLAADNPQQIAAISIKKDWAGRKLIVDVEDRQAVISWGANNKIYGVDQFGVVTAELGRGVGGNLTQIVDSSNLDVNIGGAVAPAQFVTFVREISSQLKPKTGLDWLRGRIVETTNELLVDTAAGYYLRVDTTLPATDQLDTFKTLLDRGIKPTQYIDLRLPYKLYYR